MKLLYAIYNFMWGDLVTIPLPGGGSVGLSLLVLILVPAGIFFTFRTRFLPVRLFPEMIHVTLEKETSAKKEGISGFQALIVSTATRVGMGNLVGVVAAVSATLNGYLFLKNATFRLLYTTFKRGTPGRAYLDNLKKDSATMQKLYIPNLIQFLANCDPTNTQIFISRMQQFRPRLVMNMIEDPKDADRAQRIKSSCNQYLGLEIEYLGLMYRDMLQDKALASQLPVVVYKPQSVLGQAIYRIADKIISTVPHQFDAAFNPDSFSTDNFQLAEEDAAEDYNLKLSGIDDLVSSGSLSIGELAEMIKTQQYEINQLRKENNLLKSKLVKASEQGFRI